MRYTNVPIEKDPSTGKRYYKALKYPFIPYSDSDLYIITRAGDRLDILADHYYNAVDDYWILMAANDIPRDSLYPPIGIQLRIPIDTSYVRELFDRINNL